MTELSNQLQTRAREAISSLHEARESGDDYLVEVVSAEIEGLGRLAREHGLRIPELA